MYGVLGLGYGASLATFNNVMGKAKLSQEFTEV